jgi:hypothetical protein
MDRRFEGWSGRGGARGCALLLACVGAALTVGLAASFANSAPSFPGRTSYPTGSAPRSVVIGDLNGDGKPELATANARYETNTVSVLANRGDGSFKAKRDYATGPGPLSVAFGDLNGDGKPELATANVSGNSISVFANRGDGSFQSKLEYATGSGPFSVAIGDLNGDGKPDLATANANYGGAGTVSVLLNRGDGSFGAKVDYATGHFPVSIAIGDLNGDGKPELVTANGDANSVSVLLNSGDGSFQPNLDDPTGTPVSVAIGDLNGDGKPDLATANIGANSISLLLNSGDGSFQAKRDYATARGPDSVAIGDLNGDGKPELVTANADANSVSVLANATGLCVVSNVVGKTLPAAKRTMERADCRVGKIRRVYSRTIKRDRVISQKPKPGSVLPKRGKVNLVVSRGRKR